MMLRKTTTLPKGDWFLMEDVKNFLAQRFPDEPLWNYFELECRYGAVKEFFEDKDSKVWIGKSDVRKFFSTYFDNETEHPDAFRWLTPRTIAEQNFVELEVYVPEYYNF
jgi:hypothetical protein